MSHKDGLLYAHGIEDLDIVSRPCLDIVAVFGLARWQPSTAGDPNDVEEIGELECKIIEYVRVFAPPGQQHHHLSLTAPVQHLQLDARCDPNKSLCFIWGGI